MEKREIHCHANFFASNQFRVKLFSIKLLSRKFCEKMVAVKFCNFHTTVWKNEKFSLTKKIFRQSNALVISLIKTLLSRNFCQKCVTLFKSEQFPNCEFIFCNFYVFARISISHEIKPYFDFVIYNSQRIKLVFLNTFYLLISRRIQAVLILLKSRSLLILRHF